MDMLHLLLIATRLACVFLETCHKVKVYEKKRLLYGSISCFVYIPLEQCALECLLVKSCRSFNHGKGTYDGVNYTICELNNVTRNEVKHVNFEDDEDYAYADIQDWPMLVADTCAHRPCAENQRCLPTTPYRCITVDCGTHPGLLHPRINASLGSHARYNCSDNTIILGSNSGHTFACKDMTYFDLICNADSSWAVNDPSRFCLKI